ncbi:hypothetical protein C4D60_Mb11t03750 [Musa balbisiana]|uniref:Tetraspanin-10 n=1 Tax=Musa balbisiana TaxID=52838 RepID=A0A4S8J1K6_MUSBA|nr:hypothetical protein C4D60_Mb11t03750 [Musa balbisiana]
MSAGASTFVIRWINFFTMILAVAVVCFGVWMSIHHDECRKSLTLPVIGLGALILLVSLIGFLGAWKNVTVLLWVYLVMLCLILVSIMIFTVVAFIITNSGSGHAAAGLRCGYPAVNASYYDLSYHPVSTNKDCKLYKNARAIKCYDCDSCKAGVAQYMKEEWRVVAIFNVILFVALVQGVSSSGLQFLVLKAVCPLQFACCFKLNNTKNWRSLKSCLVKSEQCNNLPKRYKNLKEYKLAELSPIEAGCCRPPSECGYPAVNASYYDLSYHPVSTNKDCKLYKNARAIKCYDCDSCKAGVAQYMKEEWRVVAIFNVILFVALSIVYFIGCCARRNVSSSHSSKARGR